MEQNDFGVVGRLHCSCWMCGSCFFWLRCVEEEDKPWAGGMMGEIAEKSLKKMDLTEIDPYPFLVDRAPYRLGQMSGCTNIDQGWFKRGRKW
uniref:Uncharacterized protein n=1 Tax=Oryza brachyantha TaxID=4533 RepID=J3MST1_ORYBR